MRREEQKAINEKVLEAIENKKFLEALNKYEKEGFKGFGTAERLYNCSAITYTYNDKYIILQSYNTIIAFIYDGVCYDFLRLVYGYTATSAQHISKFMKKYGITRKLTYKDI